jgi:hypothetical protein
VIDPADPDATSFAARDSLEPVVVDGPPTLPTGSRIELPAGREVACKHTPCNDVELLAILRAGHVLAFGVEPSYERLGMAWAMACLENARGRATYCGCIGNQDETADWTGSIFSFTAPEVIAGARVERRKILRAYDTLEAGAAGYWRRLAEGYGGALELFDTGDGGRVARKLKSLRYFTDDVEKYVAAIVSLVREYHHRWPPGAD